MQAFQPGAFQYPGFQTEAGLAFQPGAFQYPGFQTEAGLWQPPFIPVAQALVETHKRRKDEEAMIMILLGISQ